MKKYLKNSIVFILMVVTLLLVVVMSLAASKPTINISTETVNDKKENNLKYGKWQGLGMGIFSSSDNIFQLSDFFGDQVDVLLANGFTQLRIDIPGWACANSLVISKSGVTAAVTKGAQVIWGVGNGTVILTDANWASFRQGILDNAQWAQNNGVYEFQLGNELECHNDDTTLTDAQLITNLKSVASDVQEIFTNGNISYTCMHSNISDWISVGKGDIDILASNVYMEYGAHHTQPWKAEIDTLVSAFGLSGTYLTEFGPNSNGINYYSENEVVQAVAVKEMLDYIIASGMTRSNYFCYYDNSRGFGPTGFGTLKDDGTYRLTWKVLTSYNAVLDITTSKYNRAFY